jgi:hypothetical protein
MSERMTAGFIHGVGLQGVADGEQQPPPLPIATGRCANYGGGHENSYRAIGNETVLHFAVKPLVAVARA